MWKSICLVMKKKIQPDLTSFDTSKKLSAKIALKLYFRKNWGTKSVFSHYVHKLVRKSTFHILYIKLYINLFKIHCFWFFNKILYWNSVGIEFKQWFILLSNKKLNSKEGHVHLSLIDEAHSTKVIRPCIKISLIWVMWNFIYGFQILFLGLLGKLMEFGNLFYRQSVEFLRGNYSWSCTLN